MYLIKKNLLMLNLLSVLLSTATLRGMDFITITDPIINAYGSVYGQSLIMDGTASQPDAIVNLFIDGIQTYSTTTDQYGNWSIASPYLDDGIHTLTATLVDPYTLYALATQTISFTVFNPETITITSPLTASTAPLNPIVLTGTSSLPLAPVNLFLDGKYIASTTTDAYGNWQISYTLIIANGTHTFLVQLIADNNVVSGSASVAINVANSITITNPISASYGTVSGKPLMVNGIASLANVTVGLMCDNMRMPVAVTDTNGNWSTTCNNLSNGEHTITAQLSAPGPLSDFFATDQVTCMVATPPTITILNPAEGNTISYTPIVLSGAASLPLTPVQIYLDGTLVITTSTDSNGKWQASYASTITNGSHTFLVKLVDNYDYTALASATVDINIAVPIVFPTGKTQVRVVAGLIPTSGSGSGPGYAYNISGSIATINFTPAFDSIPSIIATGLRSSGSSTVTVTSITPTATSIAFSTGTQYINFTAAIFS